MKIKELKEIIRESLKEMLQEDESIKEVISGMGAGMSGRVAGTASKGGAPGTVGGGEDTRWKAQLTALAKKAIAGDAKAMSNAKVMARDSKPGTYGKEVFDYLSNWEKGQVKAAPAPLNEAVAEARLRKMIREAIQEEMTLAKKGK